MTCIKGDIISSYAKQKRRRKAVTTGIFATGLVILLIAALSYYGVNVGSFVIRMSHPDDGRSLGLSIEDLDNEEAVITGTTASRLTADPLKNCRDSEYEWIPSNVDEGMGAKNGTKDGLDIYFAYTFYLVNPGTEPLNYNMTVSLLSATRNLDEILRVMIIENGNFDDANVYAKRQGSKGNNPNEPEELIATVNGEKVSLKDTIPFTSDNTICKIHYKDFNVGAYRRYTFVMWLDGWDLEETDDMLGGGLKLEMDFSVTD